LSFCPHKINPEGQTGNLNKNKVKTADSPKQDAGFLYDQH